MGTVSIRLPEETRAKARKYRIEIGEVARKAIDEEIRRREREEALKAAESLGEYLSQIPREKIREWIREGREND